MPNWCHNRVDILGDVDEIKRFKEFVDSVKEPFSFQSIVPIPEELYKVQSPVSIRTQDEIDEFIKEHSVDYLETVSLPITSEMYNKYLKKYGYSNWYDFANEKWGTKWDAQEVVLDEYFNSLHYTFDTAWGPPNQIYLKLVAEFPKLNISWFWDEPGMEMAGYLQ